MLSRPENIDLGPILSNPVLIPAYQPQGSRDYGV